MSFESVHDGVAITEDLSMTGFWEGTLESEDEEGKEFAQGHMGPVGLVGGRAVGPKDVKKRSCPVSVHVMEVRGGRWGGM